VQIWEADKRLAQRRGSLLFAHFGLSGPVILDASQAVSKHPQPGSLVLEIDFLPAMNQPELDEFLRHESLTSGKKQLAVVLSTHLPRRLCDKLLEAAGLSSDRKAA